jgi:coenzyme F420-0:L-glutamate ligase/coenzyme F420-1:gamma-L-glutamate ligase
MTTREIRVIPVPFEDEIKPGDDLADKLRAALRNQKLRLQDGDTLVMKHKIVSKSEGQIVELSSVKPSRAAKDWAQKSGTDARLVELVLCESERIVRKRILGEIGERKPGEGKPGEKRGVLITETRHGLVCANSGVDASNVDGGDRAVLLPKDADRSAARMRSQIKKTQGVTVAVIIADSFGRPWREGLTEVAIGVAGMKPLMDYRGKRDPHGYQLRASYEAVADELACAAGLVCGKLNRTPVCIVRGFTYQPGKGSARELIRAKENDLFR